SGTEENPIYFGVDQTWYTGGAWARPIFNAEGTEPTASPEGQKTMMRAYGSWIIVDNIEFTGVAQLHGGDNGYGAGMLSISPSSPHDGGEVKNCYFHGWSHGPTTAGVWDEGEDQGLDAGDNSIILTSALISESPNFNLKIHDNVWDGSDTTGDMAMAYKGSAGHFYNNYITKMSNGIVTTGGRYYWGNTFKDIAKDDTETGCPLRQPTNFSFSCTTHGNSIESMNTQSIIYNNLFQNVGGGVIIWTQPKLNVADYVFNNVIVDGSSIGIQISATSLIEGNSAGFHVFNNSIQGGTNAARITGPAEAVYISFGTVRSNLLIGTGAGISFNHTTTQTDGNNIVMTNAEATSAGYVATGTYPFLPPTGGVTVEAGIDLQSLAAGIPSTTISDAATAALSGTSLGVKYDATNHRIIGPNITPMLRGTKWDVGAYAYEALPPPQNLSITIW
ncbi:MAG: hypothetical protein KAS04_06715, partial [Candidatus Aenigmarchaeota archaeon]|nr:hypothetical protein [Candidatus Aenigmarchaeota archaeon]